MKQGRFIMAVGSGLVLLGATVGQAEPSKGIKAGPLTVNLGADVSVTHDSNVYYTDSNRKSDLFSTLGLGAGVSFEGKSLNAALECFGMTRNYSDATDLNFSGFGEAARIGYAAESGLRLEAFQSFKRLEDVDTGTQQTVGGADLGLDSVVDASRTRRDVSQFRVSGSHKVTEKVDASLGYKYESVNYDSSSIADLSGQAGTLEGGYKLTDKLAALLVGTVGSQSSDAISESLDYTTLQAGFRFKETAKVSIRAVAGVQSYNTPADNSDTSIVSYDVMADWLATDKLTVQAGCRDGVVLGSIYASNPSEYTTLWVGGTVKLTQSFTASAIGSYRMDDYVEKVDVAGAMVDRNDKRTAAVLRGDYLPPGLPMCSVYGEALVESVSSVAGDYDDVRFTLGTKVGF